MLRSIGSVVAGFCLWTVLWLASNAGLTAGLPGTFREDGSVESGGVLMVILALSVVFSIAAGYATAGLARTAPMKHVLALGLLQLVVGIFVQSQYWTVMPLWYHLAFLALLIPGIFVGGSIRVALAGKAVRPATA